MALWNGTATGVVDALQGINTLAYGYLFSIVAVGIWLILTFRNPAIPIRDRIAVSSFSTFVIVLFLRFLGLVSDAFLGLWVAALIVSIIPLFNRGD